MARRCVLTGKRPNVAHKVSHSNTKTKRRQLPNLQHKRLWWEQGARFVRLRVSTEALRTIAKNGLDQFAKDVGVDLREY